MPRPWRVEFSGACYHVINRGNYRRNLFRDPGAADALERTLAEAVLRHGWLVHAYVIMSNHFHLALELTEPNLSAGMKWLQGTWIRRYNGFRKLVGRPFQGRYKALLVEPGEALGRVCHYIHLNPVRAGIVAPAEAATYPWSSLPKFLVRPRADWLVATSLAAAGGLPDTPGGWRKYLGYLEFLASDDTARGTLIARKLSRGWCIGGQEFRDEMRREHDLRRALAERFSGLEPDHFRAERELAWEVQLQALSAVAKIDLRDLGPRKSAPEKVRLAAALKQISSVSNLWLATRLQMGAAASASQFARRYLLQEAGRADVASLVSRVKT